MAKTKKKSVFSIIKMAIKSAYEGFLKTEPNVHKLELQKKQIEPFEKKTEDRREQKTNYTLDLNKVESFPITVNNETSTELALRAMSDIGYEPSLEKISYITDLHLLHKFQENGANSYERIQELIDSIVETILDESSRILLIGGDISSDFNIFELFLKQLSIKNHADGYYKNKFIFFVLGNHEFWDFPGLEVDEIVEKYKKIASQYDVHILHNEVAYINKAYLTAENRYVDKKLLFISTDELNTIEDTDLRKRLRMASIVILGGTGFSGCNDEFNANNGLYRMTINREQEIEESNKFKKIYSRITQVLTDKKVIVFTHTPMECWNEKPNYQSNYIYVSGHTHKNYRHDDGEIRIYADNQIGYYNENPHVKWFYYDGTLDFFADYNDGIHEITRFEYIHFNRCKNIWPQFNKEFDTLYMLKKKGYYCFIIERKNKLLILNGGKDYSLPSNDINYYFKNMDLVIEQIVDPLGEYTAFQKKIAREIQSFGGEGRIHGCIIDIDFYNHVYVNPIDHKITSYYALDMSDKWVYSSVAALLKDNNQEMYARFNSLVSENSIKLPILYYQSIDEKSPQHYLEKDIYAASRELCKLQKLHSNILTVWRTLRSKENLIPG